MFLVLEHGPRDFAQRMQEAAIVLHIACYSGILFGVLEEGANKLLSGL